MSNYDKDFIQFSEKKVKEETNHLALYFVVHISLYIVLLFFLIFFAWYTVFISTHKFYAVKGVSMMSTLNSQITEDQLYNDLDKALGLSYDAVYVDKMTKPKIFDVIVVEKTVTDSVIKRLMAMEGDYITIAKGKSENGNDRFYFYRIPNGTVLKEMSDETAKVSENGENGYKLYNSESLWIHKSNGFEIQKIDVEIEGETFSNEYEYNFYDTFLKNYNNPNSSNEYFVSSNGLIYVKVPEGQFFYMGDNRAFSTDCRERGFCNVNFIVGRAEFFVYDYNFGNRLWEVVKFYFSEMEKFFAR